MGYATPCWGTHHQIGTPDMALTDNEIRAAKATEKPQKLYDERGLYLLVSPTGGKLWRFKYRHEGREKLIGLGQYPDVGLKAARDRREAARSKVADGIDPSAERVDVVARVRGSRCGHVTGGPRLSQPGLAIWWAAAGYAGGCGCHRSSLGCRTCVG